MVSIDESRRRQEAAELGKRGFYLTDLERLNEIYQAAKAVLIQPDKFALSRLAKAIHQAEWGQDG
jgi:hypothetical protein